MKILIVTNDSNPEAIEKGLEVSAWLTSLGLEIGLLQVSTLESTSSLFDSSTIVGEADLDMVICLGGDGTILKTARAIRFRPIPILGFNFGHLGFLAGCTREHVYDAITAALSGEVAVERRTTLDCEMSFPSGAVIHDMALNEYAITHGGSGSMVNFDLLINGMKLASMSGDGLVVSTATGSTAYALAAGGPVTSPSHRGLVVVPIAPHTLVSRAVVTSPEDVVEVILADDQHARHFCDGIRFDLEEAPSSIVISTSDKEVVLLRYDKDAFYAAAARSFFGVNDA